MRKLAQVLAQVLLRYCPWPAWRARSPGAARVNIGGLHDLISTCKSQLLRHADVLKAYRWHQRSVCSVALGTDVRAPNSRASVAQVRRKFYFRLWSTPRFWSRRPRLLAGMTQRGLIWAGCKMTGSRKECASWCKFWRKFGFRHNTPT